MDIINTWPTNSGQKFSTSRLSYRVFYLSKITLLFSLGIFFPVVLEHLTEERMLIEMFFFCFRGARHGLKMNGKLARIEQQEAAEKLKDDTNNGDINNSGEVTKKKKKKKSKYSSDEVIEATHRTEEETVKERKKKKDKSKKIYDQELNEEIVSKEKQSDVEKNLSKCNVTSLSHQNYDDATANFEVSRSNGDFARTEIQDDVKKSKKKKRKKEKDAEKYAELNDNPKKKRKFCDSTGGAIVEETKITKKSKKKKSKAQDL